MLLSRKMMEKFIPSINNITNIEITKAANAIGAEVEQIITHPKTNNTVIGKIIEIKKHPNADKLNVCTVQLKNETLTIVCGASRLLVGKKVVVSLEGAILHNGIKLVNKEVRGVLSQGMMCSYGELTPYNEFLSDQELDEIIMLDDEVCVGDTNYHSAIGLDDEIFDLSLPSNRNDLQAIAILSYEIAGQLNVEYKFDLSINFKSSPIIGPDIVFDSFNLISYSDIKICKSSWKIKSLLMNNGIKPINNIIDLTNIITLITNNPIHVYDSNKINGKLTCKVASKSADFNTINNKDIKIEKGDIVVCDDTKEVSIASVIGSSNSSISIDTKNITVEIGNFNFLSIRNSSNRLNISNESSKRFSKKLSSFLTMLAVECLLKKMPNPINTMFLNNENWNKNTISISESLYSQFMGMQYNNKNFAANIKRFGFNLIDSKVSIPEWRLDVNNQQDIFEEELKVIDVNKMVSKPINEPNVPIVNNQGYINVNSLKDILLLNNFNQINTYNLVSKNEFNNLNIFNLTDPIIIPTTNTNRQCLKSNLISTMLKVYKRNESFKIDLVPAFELQKIYTINKTYNNLTCMIPKNYSNNTLKGAECTNNLLKLRAICNEISRVFNIKLDITSAFDKVKMFYDNEQLAISYDGLIVGYMGKLTNKIMKQYELSNFQFYCLTLNIESFKSQEGTFKIKEPSSNQINYYDINMESSVSDPLAVSDFIDKVLSIKLIKKANVIDYFTNKEKMINIYTIRCFIDDEVKLEQVMFDDIKASLLKLIKV